MPTAAPAGYHSTSPYLSVTQAERLVDFVTGAEPTSPPADQFYGDRLAGIIDPAGNQWWIATHIEDVDADEFQRRATPRT